MKQWNTLVWKPLYFCNIEYCTAWCRNDFQYTIAINFATLVIVIIIVRQRLMVQEGLVNKDKRVGHISL